MPTSFSKLEKKALDSLFNRIKNIDSSLELWVGANHKINTFCIAYNPVFNTKTYYRNILYSNYADLLFNVVQSNPTFLELPAGNFTSNPCIRNIEFVRYMFLPVAIANKELIAKNVF